MLDHISLSVASYTASRDFYVKALRPLGYELAMEFGQAAGFGIKGKPDFWIAAGKPQQPPVHVAFASPDHATVDAFYRTAIASGGKDNGPPGLRPHYHPAYYAAFVLDPDGNNIEAVCHAPK